MMREFIRSILCSVLVAAIANGQQPNVLLILGDDPGWVDLSVRSDPNNPDSRTDFYQTPRLEQLASQGMVLSNAYSSSPVCSATRASIQTGKSPAALGMTTILAGGQPGTPYHTNNYVGKNLIPPLVHDSLPQSEVTIADQLAAHDPNYITAHIQKWDLDQKGPGGSPNIIGPLSQGYDYAATGFMVFPEGTDPKQNAGAAKRLTDWWENNPGKPFYAQLSLSTVHTPYEALQSNIDKICRAAAWHQARSTALRGDDRGNGHDGRYRPRQTR